MSASVFTTIYVAGFRPEALSFLLFIAVGPAVLGLLALPFLDAQTGSATITEDGKGKGGPSHHRPERAYRGVCLVAVSCQAEINTAVMSGSGTMAGIHNQIGPHCCMYSGRSISAVTGTTLVQGRCAGELHVESEYSLKGTYSMIYELTTHVTLVPHALMQHARCAGRRFGAAFCVVIMLALYQLGTSGLMGVQDWMPAGVRGALLGGLAALLLPLLFLWPGSGGLLVQEACKGGCDEEEAFQHPGEVQSACSHIKSISEISSPAAEE